MLGVAGRCCFPIDDALRAVNLTDRIDVLDEVAATWKRARQFHLKVLVRTSYPNSIILSKTFEQVNPLVIEPIPGIILRVCK